MSLLSIACAGGRGISIAGSVINFLRKSSLQGAKKVGDQPLPRAVAHLALASLCRGAETRPAAVCARKI
jgi:hypothetical protein